MFLFIFQQQSQNNQKELTENKSADLNKSYKHKLLFIFSNYYFTQT